MRFQTKNSQFQGSGILEDLAVSKNVSNWFKSILVGTATFRPLNLIYNADGKSKVLIEHGVFSGDAFAFIENMIKTDDQKLEFLHDSIDIFVNMETKQITVNILE